MKILLIVLLGVLSMGAVYNSSNGFKYEVELNIYTSDEISQLKPGFGKSGENQRNNYYLYGRIRLSEWPKNVWSMVPRCNLRVWNKDFSVVLKLFDLTDPSEILIPLGSSIRDKKFQISIK